jgi:hypothetical protein
MADNLADNFNESDKTGTGRTRSASRLAVLTSLIAGAFAAWIIIASNLPG